MREWLIKHRKSKKLTQQQVAACCFIERSYYSQIERGKRNPSTNVAKNIAIVLGFNPVKFFKSDLDFTFDPNIHLNKNYDRSIQCKYERYIKCYEYGQMVYLYNNMQHYFNRILTFLFTGVQNSSHCIIIDDKKNLDHFNHMLINLISNENITDYVHEIELERDKQQECDLLIKMIRDIIHELIATESLCIWINNEKLNQYDLMEYIRIAFRQETRNILFIVAYNASMVSASEHIIMMKKYPLLMTDEEIVSSPFNDRENSYIFPSLYIQEDSEIPLQ